MNGDKVRDTSFVRSSRGYIVSEVDDLLARVAAELDVGRLTRPLIASAKFGKERWLPTGYDIDAVDWFLDQLLLRPGDFEQAGSGFGPWHHLAVTNQFEAGTDFVAQCENAWRGFGLLPGTP